MTTRPTTGLFRRNRSVALVPFFIGPLVFQGRYLFLLLPLRAIYTKPKSPYLVVRGFWGSCPTLGEYRPGLPDQVEYLGFDDFAVRPVVILHSIPQRGRDHADVPLSFERARLTRFADPGNQSPRK